MDNFGFIHDRLDIKILILYILDKLPAPAEANILSELVLFDGGFTWFDYTDCLADLEKTEHIVLENNQYSITEKGRRNIGYVGSSLPFSVRAKADRLCAPVAAAMRRSSMIEAVSEPNRDGSYAVSLRLSDGVGEILSLRLTAGSEEQSKAIEMRFRDHAEELCNRIIEILTEK